MASLADIPEVITVAEAAQKLGISTSKVYELLASGELRCIHIGRSRRISVDDLLEFIAACTN